MLPRQVADDLRQGKSAAAQSYVSATVFFRSDVCVCVRESVSVCECVCSHCPEPSRYHLIPYSITLLIAMTFDYIYIYSSVDPLNLIQMEGHMLN